MAKKFKKGELTVDECIDWIKREKVRRIKKSVIIITNHDGSRDMIDVLSEITRYLKKLKKLELK